MEQKKRSGPKLKWGIATSVKSVRSPVDLWDDLATLAERAGITRNEFIVRTMKRKVNRELR